MYNGMRHTLIVPPPRRVPWDIRIKVLSGGASQFGWIFFGFGMIFFWLFVLNADVTSWYYFLGRLEKQEGEITQSIKAGFSQGGSKHSKGTPIYANHYTFSAPDGNRYLGISYALGRYLTKGTPVVIEYPENNPSISRIQGMRRAALPPVVLFVLIFPVLGLVFINEALVSGRKAIRLLKNGKLAFGRMRSKDICGWVHRKNGPNEPIYKLIFEFVDESGKNCEACLRSPSIKFVTDEQEEPLLYDFLNPSYAVLLDSLPGLPKIDSTGNLAGPGAVSAIRSLILPALAIFGHGIYIYFRFFS